MVEVNREEVIYVLERLYGLDICLLNLSCLLEIWCYIVWFDDDEKFNFFGDGEIVSLVFIWRSYMEDLDWGLGMNSLEFINKYNVYNMLLLFVFSIILYDVSNYESYVEDEVEVKEEMESVYVFLIY